MLNKKYSHVVSGMWPRVIFKIHFKKKKSFAKPSMKSESHVFKT